MARTDDGVRSMTGFARKQGGDGRVGWIWEVKSVNGRSLEVRCRLPAGYESLEPSVRATMAAHCARGNVQLSLTVDRGEVPLTLRVNRALLDDLLELARELQAELGAPPPQVEGLLTVRGIIETVEEQPGEEELDSREAAMERRRRPARRSVPTRSRSACAARSRSCSRPRRRCPRSGWRRRRRS
jgi:uncharacterized protein (TIGR00255 family)